VHAHPDDSFAAQHLGHRHGKAEAWYILEGGTVHLGLRRDVSEMELASLVETQNVEGLLGLLHEVDVAPGDVVWVPPGARAGTRPDRSLLSCCGSPVTGTQ
jgi:mannose-6-phosphate isomerase